MIRQYCFLAPVIVSLLTERRSVAPWGLKGGGAAQAGRNFVLRSDGEREELPAKASRTLRAGDRLRVETPGGGGYGHGPDEADAESRRRVERAEDAV